MDRKNILITGNTGFIGTYLKNHYYKTHNVYAPERSRLDLTNSAAVNSFFNTNQVDVVIHTALIGRNNLNGVDNQQAHMNMEMFLNLWRNRHKFGQLINMGTGNEFDTTTNIDCAVESTLFDRMPLASYAYAKNLTARIVNTTENFYNFRLFGVFHYTENPVRFFNRLHRAVEPFHIFQDHYFDHFNLEDLPTVLDVAIEGIMPYQDLNIVYPKKYLLSELAKKFLDVHHRDHSIIAVDAISRNNFTGDPTKLASLNLELQGLSKGFCKY